MTSRHSQSKKPSHQKRQWSKLQQWKNEHNQTKMGETQSYDTVWKADFCGVRDHKTQLACRKRDQEFCVTFKTVIPVLWRVFRSAILLVDSLAWLRVKRHFKHSAHCCTSSSDLHVSSKKRKKKKKRWALSIFCRLTYLHLIKMPKPSQGLE